ncbi:MAG: amidase [Planctomycetes bacterium]|nr:amidase [Planctomycetota bacterium]
MTDEGPCLLSAVAQRALIERGELSSRELVAASLARIARLDPKLNAIVTLVGDEAIRGAAEADERQARGEQLGILHGLPVVHKDLHETRGIRTTYGSPIHADFIPSFDALIVERQRRAGAIALGKTNTPEFGAGSQTYNTVFGATANPYDPSKTCGGSSGGTAVALACRFASLGDGSDMGGSLRNPASFCNVVGLRPSPGRVPEWPRDQAWFTLSVPGPMGRTVEDTALLLAAIAGPDERSPIALPDPGAIFLGALETDLRGKRIAWSPRWGGLPVARDVMATLERAVPAFEQLGCEVIREDLDLRDADEIFLTLRAWYFERRFAPLVESHPDRVKESIVWNVEQGRALRGSDVARAEVLRTRLYDRTRAFFRRFDYVIGPVTQVLPFDIGEPYPRDIDGAAMGSYVEWMKSCYWISATGLPALSVPAGFSTGGLPVGLQIVGPYRGDLTVLRLGYAFQQVTSFGSRRPPAD